MADYAAWLPADDDEPELSESTRAWLAAQPTTGDVGSVFTRAAAIDAQDRADDRRRAERLAEAQDAAEGLAFVEAIRGIPPRTHTDVLAEASARAELQDVAERADRRREADRRLADREARVAELEAQLAAERNRAAFVTRGLRQANDLVARERGQGAGFPGRSSYAR